MFHHNIMSLTYIDSGVNARKCRKIRKREVILQEINITGK